MAAQAQDMTGTMTGTMSSSTTMSSGSTMQPTLVTGTVLRYYVDRSGYVTAADVQTANGVQFVRFSPSMAQRVYSTYPVGGQMSAYVTGSPNNMGGTNWYVVGLGDQMPAAGFMNAYMVNDVDLLRAEPYIMVGTRMAQFKGQLRSVVTDTNGEVLGLVLSGVKLANAMPLPADAPAGTAMMGDMTGDVLVRVPRELRHANTMSQVAGSERVAGLFPGAEVEVVGYPEAPRYGVLSRFGQRVAASAIVLNGREVGALGIPKMDMASTSTLINANIGPDATNEERTAAGMGYSIYNQSGTMMTPAGSGAGGAMGTGAGAGAAPGTTTGGM
jgi:hypothetical protein